MVPEITDNSTDYRVNADGRTALNSSPRVGLVIPCRGDAALLDKCLESLADFISASEKVVVVNADNSPATQYAANQAGVECITSDKPDRGRAIAAGVDYLLHHCSPPPDVILIAHADMIFAPQTRAALMQTLGNNARRRWGSVGHRIASNRSIFRLVEAGNRLRARTFHTPYGDQAIFFGLDILAAAGGFPRQDCMEDCELSLRLKIVTDPIYLDYPVIISDRHWKNGVIRTSVRNWFTATRYIMSRCQPCAVPRGTAASHGPVAI